MFIVPRATAAPVCNPSVGKSSPLAACFKLWTQLGGSWLANDCTRYCGLASLASCSLNLPKLKPATVCGASLFQTVMLCPPSLLSLTSSPVATIFIPLGIWKVMS